jgi:negative regulator of flagellin synthesis FlgM
MDAKVTIPEAIKDFAKIKKIVDEEPTINNEKKINRIRNEIKAGSYNINYEQLADKIIENEF